MNNHLFKDTKSLLFILSLFLKLSENYIKQKKDVRKHVSKLNQRNDKSKNKRKRVNGGIKLYSQSLDYSKLTSLYDLNRNPINDRRLIRL